MPDLIAPSDEELTAAEVAAITGTPVRIENIRARRPKPGLQRQHLVAVQAAALSAAAGVPYQPDLIE